VSGSRESPIDGEPPPASRLRSWRAAWSTGSRRTRWLIAVAALLALLIVLRTAASLWPPSLRRGREWSALAGVTVINPGRDRRENQTIIMRGDRIESIRDRGADGPLLPRAQLYDKRFVLPGLVDLDVRRLPDAAHLRGMFGVFFLAAGVTTVRTAGGCDDACSDLRQRSAAGELPWPRLVACGPVLDGDRPACRGGRVVHGAVEARRAVDEIAAAGAGCVAVRWSLAAADLPAVLAAAAARGLPVVGDVPRGVPLDDAGLADVHLLSILPPATSPARPADWLRGWAALSPTAVDALVRAAAARPAAYTPNLVRWNQLALNEANLAATSLLELLPRFYRDTLWPRALSELRGAPSLTAAEAAQAMATIRLVVRRLHEAGVPIHVGSATPSPYVMPGYSLWSEMVELVGAGFTLEDVWVMATRRAGAALAIPQLGTLEAGAPADLLIFGRDPTVDSDALLSLEAVVAQGRLYPKRLLNGGVLEHARYVRRGAYDSLSWLMPEAMMWWEGVQDVGCETP
jgi:imidazolonepropionase-like amidohydrolase